MATPDLSQLSEDLRNRIEAKLQQRQEALELETAWATKLGLTPTGEATNPSEAEANIILYGAETPKHAYCYSLPLRSLVDIAKDWDISLARLQTWASRGNWEALRQQHLQTVPVQHGGKRIDGKWEDLKEFFLETIFTDILEAQKITMDRMRQRQEEAATKEGVFSLDKTSAAHNADVNSLKTINEMGRMALGMPTKYTASISQSTSTRIQVKESVVNAPTAAPEKAFDIDDDLHPKPLPAMTGTKELHAARDNSFRVESGAETVEGELVEVGSATDHETTKTLTATYGPNDEDDED